MFETALAVGPKGGTESLSVVTAFGALEAWLRTIL